MHKLLNWMFSHWLTSCFMLAVVGAFTVIFGLDWAAEASWQRYAREARARGARISPGDFPPQSAPPDSENFGALPLFRHPSKLTLHVSRSSRVNVYAPSVPHPLTGKPEDWDNYWTDYPKYFLKAGYIKEISDNGPRDVLLALDHYAPEFAEWRQWRQRPVIYLAADIKPSDAAMTALHMAEFFELRMRANLKLGNSGEACGDFQNALQGYAVLKDISPYSEVVSSTFLGEVVTAIGQGLSEERWKASDLETIQANLESIRIWQDYRNVMGRQRANSNLEIENVAHSGPARRRVLYANLFEGSQFKSTAFAWAPSFFFRLNQLHANVDLDELTARVTPDGAGYNPNLPNPSSPELLNNSLSRLSLCLFRVCGLEYMDIVDRYERPALELQQAIIACALERYRLANGAFPDSLEALAPAYLKSIPIDFYSQKPMLYRRDGAKSFVLYSVGRNRIDDGGIIDRKRGQWQQADDIWLFAPPTSP